MKNLQLHNIDLIDTLAWPTTELFITAKTSALSILTDFTQHRPLVIRSNVKAIELEKLMKQSHVKMKLVIDDNDKFVGLVTLYDLSEENILKQVDKTTSRNDLTVKDFMHDKRDLKCFDYHELENATVGDVLATQKENHLQHCLVIDTQLNMIRGVISARDIARLITPNVDAAKHFSFENLYNEHKTKFAV